MEKKRPILSIRPHFVPGLAMVQSIMFMAVGFIVVTVAGSIFTYLILSLILPAKFVSFSVIMQFYLLVSVAGIPPLFYEIKKRALQRTLYNFHEDYLEFQYFHFYINRRRGRLWYRDVADITQHASFLQERHRLTTIYLYVPGMVGAHRQRGFMGIKLEDLPQSKGYLNKIMDVIDFELSGRLSDWLANQLGVQQAMPETLPPQSPPSVPSLPPEAKAVSAGASPAQPPPVTEPATEPLAEAPESGQKA